MIALVVSYQRRRICTHLHMVTCTIWRPSKAEAAVQDYSDVVQLMEEDGAATGTLFLRGFRKGSSPGALCDRRNFRLPERVCSTSSRTRGDCIWAKGQEAMGGSCSGAVA